jgi:hypothetical protein
MTNSTATATAAPETVAYLTTNGGWGAWVRVTVADTPEADAAAAAFFRRACAYEVGQQDYAASHVDEEATTGLGPAMAAYFYPVCEHGLSAHLCAGPGHYPADA